jgi:uncharacterized membrane protein
MDSSLPIAWNSYGVPTKYITKIIALFIIPLKILFLAILLSLIKKIKDNKNIKIFSLSYDNFSLFLIIILNIIAMLPLYLINFDGGNTYNLLAFILLFTAILIFIMGIVFSLIKEDSKYGFKTPWTKASKNVFIKTQKYTSIIFIFGSLILAVITLFINDYTTISVLGYVLICLILILLPLLYSKKLYEEE